VVDDGVCALQSTVESRWSVCLCPDVLAVATVTGHTSEGYGLGLAPSSDNGENICDVHSSARLSYGIDPMIIRIGLN